MLSFFGKNREAKFWTWFEQNSQRLLNFADNPEPIFNDLTRQLHRINDNLTFEMSTKAGSTGKREFIVSADGISEAFPAVETLVAAAPELADWTVIAFRPPKELTSVVRFGELQLGPDDIWFRCEPDGEKTGLTLHVRGLEEHGQQIAGAAFILLDIALGEYTVETRIGFIDWESLPAEPEAEGLQPLTALPELFGVTPQ